MTQEQIRQLMAYEIQINFLDRGCVVRVGCKSFAFDSVEKAMAELAAYTKDPIEISKKYAPMEFIELEECDEICTKPQTL
jgi:hypothetical protein